MAYRELLACGAPALADDAVERAISLRWILLCRGTDGGGHDSLEAHSQLAFRLHRVAFLGRPLGWQVPNGGEDSPRLIDQVRIRNIESVLKAFF